MGVSNTYLSMGIEHFSLQLYENRDFVLKMMDIFIDWACKAVKKINELGFDFMIIPEDLAWKQGPMFSPKMFRELFLPRMKKVAENIKIPGSTTATEPDAHPRRSSHPGDEWAGQHRAQRHGYQRA
jgi:uroporphyrinogen-III decarboxylase